MNVCYLNTSILKFNPDLDDPGFGSDLVIIDLEDSVHTHHKHLARAALATLDLEPLTRKGLRFGVRVNSLMSIDGLQDLCAISARCREGAAGISFVQLPKVESLFELELCRSALRNLPDTLDIVPIIETSKGVEHVEEIAGVSDAMMFGRVDMAACMYRVNDAYLSYARGRFCVACARHGISAIDTASFGSAADITDMSAFERDCLAGRSEGFTPRQLSILPRYLS